MCVFFVDSDCYKRGQTSRPVVGTEIQTSCNFEASLLGHRFLPDCVHSRFNSQAFLEFRNSLRVRHDSFLTVYRNLDLLLHEDLIHPSSSST